MPDRGGWTGHILLFLVRTRTPYERYLQPVFARRVNAALRGEGWDSLDKLYGFLRY